MLLQINAYLVLTAECTRYVIDLGQYMSTSLFIGWPKVRHIKNAPKDYKPEDDNDYSKWAPSRPYFVMLEGNRESIYVDAQTVREILRDYEADFKRIVREKKCSYYDNGRLKICNKDCLQCELYMKGYASLSNSYGGNISVDSINAESDDDRLYELPDDDAITPLDKMIKEENIIIIRNTIESLEEKYKAIIIYTYYENLTPTDIENKYRIPRNTVIDRLKKAKILVKERLLNYDNFKDFK